MDGIMGMQENASTSSADDVSGGASGNDNFGSDSMRGMMLLDDDFMGGNVDFDDESSDAVARGELSRRRSSIKSIYSAGKEGGGGVGDTATAGLNRKGKRTRTARSNPHHAVAAPAQPHHRLQQSKEVASLAASSPLSASVTSVKSRRVLHPSRTKEAKIMHRRDSNELQQQLQQRQKQQGEVEPLASTSKFNQYSYERQRPQSQASGPILDGEQELRLLKIRKTEKSLSKFGLATSRTLFFPYMKLPTTVLDCKIQRGQKSLYPILEKFSALLVPSSKGDDGGPADRITIPTPTSASRSTSIKSMSSTQSSNNTTRTTNQYKSVINLSSPIYSLFQHTPASSPSELIEMLTNSTDAVVSTLRHLEEERKSSHKRSSSMHYSASSLPTPSSSSHQLIDELVKIYLVHMKQSAFLRQNAFNMENWCKDHFRNEDVRTVFPVGRKSMEQVFSLLWSHDKDRAMTPVQSHQSQLEVGGQGGRRGSGTCTKSPIMISLEVKVKMSGWRDKSGTKLKANLVCPEKWKVASDRGANAAATPFPPLSSISTKTLDMVAEEILRFDLLPLKKSGSVSVATSSSTSIEIVSNDTVLEKMEDKKDSLLESDSEKMADKIDGRPKTRRKSRKNDTGYTSPLSHGASLSDAVQLSSRRGSKNAFIPHIPGFNNPLFLCRNLPRETYYDPTSGTIHEEGQRIVNALYSSILHPAVKPSKRRALLAEEVSLSLSRLNKHKRLQLARVPKLPQLLSPSIPNKIRDQIPNQMVDSQAAHLEDVELLPPSCDIAGMWKCLEKCSYFKVFEKEVDLILGEECSRQSETVEVDHVVNEDGGYYFWGSLHQKVLATPIEMNITEIKSEDESDAVETNSPLYDHLQSLLVEVEESEGVDNNDADYDDDYIIANLPSYSLEEFINGPKTGSDNKGAESAIISISDTDIDENKGDASALFCQTNLSLDQRTYIHLCAARLVDSKLPPSHHSIPPTLSSSSNPTADTTTIIEATENSNDDHIDVIVQKMKVRLSNLRDDTNAKITELHHMVLCQGPT